MIDPRATEKTYREQAKRTYVFVVNKADTKQAIAKMIAKEFNVTVTDVRVLTRKGKQTKFSKGKHAYPGITFRRDKKIAYVTLKDGDKIKVFETENEREETKPGLVSRAKASVSGRRTDKPEEAKKEEKPAKKAAKSDAKEAKTAKKAVKADKNAAKENK